MTQASDVFITIFRGRMFDIVDGVNNFLAKRSETTSLVDIKYGYQAASYDAHGQLAGEEMHSALVILKTDR